MEEIFRKLIANDFSDLVGLRADASIPVPGSLLNEIIADALQGNKTIHSSPVTIHEQNHVSVRLRTSLLPWPFHLRLKLDKMVDLESFASPKVRAWLESHHWLGSLGSLFNVLPEWAKLYGNQVVIDLGYFLHTSAQKKLFDLVKSVEIRTEEGKAILDVRIEVD
jgi:hypothetical protein